MFRRIARLMAGPGGPLDGRRVAGPSPGDPDRSCYMPQDTVVNAVLTVFEAVLLARRQGGGWVVVDAEADAVGDTLRMLEIEGWRRGI